MRREWQKGSFFRTIQRYEPVVEHLWQFLRQNILANRVFNGYDTIGNVCCDAWVALPAMPERVASFTSRDWAQANG
ncbi:hypothetical protein [Paracoccus aerius]|uniref:Transposase n=1 Tax=Paracoccus aerius TaxID=1915382 RepID=A0ABS1SAH0_9RHOB|nr:hypothetical protein [Paracoccus aerius]MBL3675725.1 hypothetical protein [Paracoccus aerius]GHG36562.1 hypothetical protein GCM10017322_39300 [Paracoccus aerius]